LLIADNKNADKVTVYTFYPGKHIWVRQKEGAFGSQTGPFLGLKGVTERGYPQDKNVKNGEYYSKEVKLTLAQKAKRKIKDVMGLGSYTIQQ